MKIWLIEVERTDGKKTPMRFVVGVDILTALDEARHAGLPVPVFRTKRCFVSRTKAKAWCRKVGYILSPRTVWESWLVNNAATVAA